MDTSKTLYISDLDGTLLNQSAKLTDYTTNILNGLIEQGLNFSVATARLLEPVCDMLANLKINIPVVLMNGVLIYDLEHEKYIKVNKLLPEVVMAVVKAIKKIEVAGFMYELNNGQLVSYYEVFEQQTLPDYVKKRIERYKAIPAPNGFSGISPENIVYFTLIDTQERLQPLHDALAAQPGLNLAFYRNIYSEDMWFLEIFSSEASKQNAVIYLKEAYGFKRVIGFGDNHNDLPMFQACDVRVAVENAPAEIKAVADFICGANDDDGVAKWLEENHKANFTQS